MQTQTVEFAIVRKRNNITKVGRTSMLQPKTNYKGGSVKWYDDKLKQKSKQFYRQRTDGSNLTEFDSLCVPFQQAIEEATSK